MQRTLHPAFTYVGNILTIPNPESRWDRAARLEAEAKKKKAAAEAEASRKRQHRQNHRDNKHDYRPKTIRKLEYGQQRTFIADFKRPRRDRRET